METLFINQDTYKLLKWLKPFLSTDTARPSLTMVHIMDKKLWAADGYSLVVVDLPGEDPAFFEYCERVKAFSILALVAKPRLAILEEEIIASNDGPSLRESIKKLVEENADMSEDYHLISVSQTLLSRIPNIPTYDNFVPCQFFVKDKTSPVVITVPGIKVLLMPMHFGQ